MTGTNNKAARGRRPAGLTPAQAEAWGRARRYVQPGDPQRIIPLVWNSTTTPTGEDDGMVVVKVDKPARQAGPFKWLTLRELTAIYSSTKGKRSRREIIAAFTFVCDGINEISDIVSEDIEGVCYINATYTLVPPYEMADMLGKASAALNGPGSVLERAAQITTILSGYYEKRYGTGDLAKISEMAAGFMQSHPVQRAMSRVIGVEADYLRPRQIRRGEGVVPTSELLSEEDRKYRMRHVRAAGHLVDNTKPGQPLAAAQLSLFENYDQHRAAAFSGIKMTGAQLSGLAHDMLELFMDKFGEWKAGRGGKTTKLSQTRARVTMENGEEMEITMKPKQLNNAPEEIPVLEYTIRQLCTELGLKETGSNTQRVKDALDELAAPRALQYVRKAKRGTNKDRKENAEPEVVRSLDSLIKVNVPQTLVTAKLQPIEISPSFIWYDQPETHYYYMPAFGWQDEVHRLNGKRVNPSGLRFIYSLFLKFADDWRQQVKRAQLMRTGCIKVAQPWQATARSMNISETTIRRNKAQVLDSIRYACGVAQGVGLLHSYMLNDAEDTMQMEINAGMIRRMMPDLPTAGRSMAALEEGMETEA